MKAFLTGLLALLISANAWALDSCMTGNWYEAGMDTNEGLTLEVLHDGTVGAGHWYGWLGEERIQYGYVGAIEDGALVFRTYQYTPSTTHYAGVGSIMAVDNDTIEIVWNQTYDWIGNPDNTMHWCFYNCDWTKTLTRLTQPVSCK